MIMFHTLNAPGRMTAHMESSRPRLLMSRYASNRLLHVPLKDLQLRSGVLLAAIVRGGVTMIPSGMTTIEEGDHVLVIARSMGLKDLTDILA